MLRRSALALAALFVFVQTFSLLHMAAHGFAEHKHHGQICDVYLSSEQTKYADTPTTPVFSLAEAVSFTVTIPAAPALHTAERYHLPLTRAPPGFLPA